MEDISGLIRDIYHLKRDSSISDRRRTLVGLANGHDSPVVSYYARRTVGISQPLKIRYELRIFAALHPVAEKLTAVAIGLAGSGLAYNLYQNMMK